MKKIKIIAILAATGLLFTFIVIVNVRQASKYESFYEGTDKNGKYTEKMEYYPTNDEVRCYSDRETEYMEEVDCMTLKNSGKLINGINQQIDMDIYIEDLKK